MYFFCTSAIQCADIPVPENGMRSGNSFHYGAKVTIYCFGDYEIYGEASSVTILCKADGNWSREVPHCQGEIFWSKK